MGFEFIHTDIKDVILIKPKVFEDERGFFLEFYKKSEFEKAGITDIFIQDNHSKSTRRVLRGLHFQLNPYAQGKLVRCIKGRIFDVAIDLRKNSPYFGRYISVELSEENKYMLFIPVGFAHGFLTLSEEAEIVYKVSNAEYNRDYDRSIRWDDEDININWPMKNPILSEKDKNAPRLKDIIGELNL